MSRPTLDLTTLGINTTNKTTSPIDLIPVRTKTPDPTPLTRPTEFPEQNRKAHVPDDLNSDPSLSDSSSKKKKRDKKKKRRKHKTDYFSDQSLSGDSDSSYNSVYRRKRCKRKSDRGNDPIKLCACLTAKLLTTAPKSKIIRFKMDEDPPQRRIYFLTFVE